MPSRRIFYWDGLKTQLDNIPHELKTTLKQILAGEYAAAWLKKIGKNLYSARINNTHRLLFTTQGRQLVLLEIVFNHNYHSAKFLNPQVLQSHRLKLAQAENDLQIIEESQLSEEDTDTLPLPEAAEDREDDNLDYSPIVPTAHGIVSLSAQQREILTTSMLTLPAVIRGEAGSGKTTVLTALLARIVQMYGALDTTAARPRAPILYIVDSKELLKETQAFFLSKIRPDAAGLVDFMTFEQLIKRHYPQAESVNTLKVFLLKEMSTRQCPVFLQEQPFSYWLEECRLISGCEDERAYQNMGRKMSLLAGQDKSLELIESEKKALWGLFQRYLASLTPGQIDLTYSCLGQSDFPRYEWMIVDESHILSAAQLRYLSRVVDNQQVIWSMDMNQRMHDRRFNHFAYLEQLHRGQWSVHDLSLSFRNPLEVQYFVAELQAMKYRVNPNSPDKRPTKAAGAASALDSKRVHMIEKLDDSYVTNLVKSLDVVIVTQEAQVLALQQKYQTGLVFTAEQVIGLEFDSVFVLDALPQGELRALEQALSSQVTKRARKQDETHDALELALNRIYVACTRVNLEGRLYFYQSGLMACSTMLSQLKPFMANAPIIPQVASSASDEKTQAVVRRLEAKGLQQQAKLVAELATTSAQETNRAAAAASTTGGAVSDQSVSLTPIKLETEWVDDRRMSQPVQQPVPINTRLSPKSNEEEASWQAQLLNNFSEENLEKIFSWLAKNYSKKKQDQLFSIEIHGYNSLVSAIILVKERLTLFIAFLKNSLMANKDYFSVFMSGCRQYLEDEESTVDKELDRARAKLGSDASLRMLIQEGGVYRHLLSLLKAIEQQDKPFFDLFVYELIKTDLGLELISAMSHLPGYDQKFTLYFLSTTPFPVINAESRMCRLLRHELGARIFWRLFDLATVKLKREMIIAVFLKNNEGTYPFVEFFKYFNEENIAHLIKNKLMRIPSGILGSSISEINSRDRVFRVENFSLFNLFFQEAIVDRILILNAIFEVDVNFFNHEISKETLCNRYKINEINSEKYSTALFDITSCEAGLRFLLVLTQRDQDQFVAKIEPSVLFTIEKNKCVMHHLFSSGTGMQLLEAWMQFPSFARSFLLHMKAHLPLGGEDIPEGSWVSYLFSTRTGHYVLRKLIQEDHAVTRMSLNTWVPLMRGIHNCVLSERVAKDDISCVINDCQLLPSGSLLLRASKLLAYTAVGMEVLKLFSSGARTSDPLACASAAESLPTGLLLAKMGLYGTTEGSERGEVVSPEQASVRG